MIRPVARHQPREAAASTRARTRLPESCRPTVQVRCLIISSSPLNPTAPDSHMQTERKRQPSRNDNKVLIRSLCCSAAIGSAIHSNGPPRANRTRTVLLRLSLCILHQVGLSAWDFFIVTMHFLEMAINLILIIDSLSVSYGHLYF